MPTINIPDKICPHCGGTKWFLSYQKYKDTVYTIYTCCVKKDENSKKWCAENREARNLIHKRSKEKVKNTKDYITKNRKRASEYYKKYPEKVRAHAKISRLKNPDKHNLASKLKKKEYVKEISDVYVKDLICYKTGLSYNDVPQELVELKRKQILLTRQIKQNEKEQQSCNN